MNKIELARKYCEQYGTTLPEAWEGLKAIRHPWHQPAHMIAFPMSYEQFLNRIIEIAEQKPEHERAERLGYMLPYTTELEMPKYIYGAWDVYCEARDACDKAEDACIKAWDACGRARDACDKAEDACIKAWDAYGRARDAYDKAWDVYYKAWDVYDKARDAHIKARDAYDEAVERWQKANKNKIEQAHAKECPDCGWDGNRLPQFD